MHWQVSAVLTANHSFAAPSRNAGHDCVCLGVWGCCMVQSYCLPVTVLSSEQCVPMSEDISAQMPPVVGETFHSMSNEPRFICAGQLHQ